VQLSEVHITRLLALGDALTVRGARPIGGLVRAAAGGAAKWCMRASKCVGFSGRELAKMLLLLHAVYLPQSESLYF
jgi:hypothetical protein